MTKSELPSHLTSSSTSEEPQRSNFLATIGRVYCASEAGG